MITKWERKDPYSYGRGNRSNHKPQSDSFLITIQELSDLLSVTKLTLKRMEARGELKAIRINSRGDRRYEREYIINKFGLASSLGGTVKS